MSAPALEAQTLPGVQPQLDAITNLIEVRRAALRLHQELGIPGAKDEEWKYTHIRKFLPEEGAAAGSSVPVDLASLNLPDFEQSLLVFVDGVYSAEHSSLGTLPSGLTVQPLETALQDASVAGLVAKLAHLEPERYEVAAHLGAVHRPATHTFGALNTAAFTSGAFVRIARDTSVETPVHLLFLSTTPNAIQFPRLLVVAESGSKACLVEHYRSLHAERAHTLAVAEVYVHENANLEYVKVQNENQETVHVGLTEVRQDANSTFRHFSVSFGGAVTRNDTNVFLAGSATHCRMDGVIALSGDQHVDNHTRLDHAHPFCDSFEVYKHLLDDRSEAVFNGKIFVHQDAQKTDAKQTNMCLLLSPEATMNTKPQLEIFADDVKCTHGATIGQLREDAMFYLRSRGIAEKTARGLLVYAFAAEVLEQIEHEGLREYLEALLFAKLGH